MLVCDTFYMQVQLAVFDIYHLSGFLLFLAEKWLVRVEMKLMNNSDQRQS